MSESLAYKFVYLLLSIPETPLLIRPPRRYLLFFVAKAWLALFILTVFTYSMVMLVTIPLLAFYAYVHYVFLKVWRRYGYSAKLLILANIAVFILSAASAGTVRAFFVHAVQSILNI